MYMYNYVYNTHNKYVKIYDCIKSANDCLLFLIAYFLNSVQLNSMCQNLLAHSTNWWHK